MKTEITIKILLLIFILSNISFSQIEIKWHRQNVQINNNLHSVFFLDSLNGWICGKQIILKTSNAGNEWFSVTAYEDWRDILFITDSIGFAGGSYRIAKSYDGGLTWYNKYSTTQWIYNFCFLDSSIGFAMGGYNKLLKTTDAGETWIQTTLPNGATVFLDAFFINDSVGWASGLEDIGGPIRGLIAKTTDSGDSWTALHIFNNGSVIYGVHFFDINFGVCLSHENFYKTTNGGVDWIIQSSIPIFTLYLNVIDNSNIWATGHKGGIYNTQNLGLTWTSTFNDSAKTIRSSIFISDDLGWAVGDSGLILTTQDIVISTSHQALKEEIFYLAQNYPNPFNPVTTISYQIPERGFVTIKVYDVLGNEVATLVNEESATGGAGSYEVEFSAIGGSAFGGNAYNLPSGIYFYQLRAGEFIETKKMILLK